MGWGHIGNMWGGGCSLGALRRMLVCVRGWDGLLCCIMGGIEWCTRILRLRVGREGGGLGMETGMVLWKVGGMGERRCIRLS